jgi:hypothetical protein
MHRKCMAAAGLSNYLVNSPDNEDGLNAMEGDKEDDEGQIEGDRKDAGGQMEVVREDAKGQIEGDREDAKGQMEGDREGGEGQMEGMDDGDQVMGDAGPTISGDVDDNRILQDAAASMRSGAWSKPQVDEYASDEEDSDMPDEDDGWDSQPEDSDNEEEPTGGLSAWDALGENFARELADVGQYIPPVLLFTITKLPSAAENLGSTDKAILQSFAIKVK